jgi:26S proteasome regulatory subunit N2
MLSNPARVIPAQEKFMKFLQGSRYEPVRAAPSGFVLLRDLKPEEAVELVLDDAPSTGATSTTPASTAAMAAVDEEPQLPQAFEYTS